MPERAVLGDVGGGVAHDTIGAGEVDHAIVVNIKGREDLMAVAVVLGALLRVAQYFVCLVDFLEALFRLVVVGVQIGMAFFRLLAVCFFDVLLGRVLGNAEDFIVVALGHDSPASDDQ